MEITLNKSRLFILPMIVDDYRELKFFKGCFIKEENHRQFDEHIFLIFYRIKGREFREYLESYKMYGDFLCTINYTDYTVLVYNVPPNLKKEYQYFKEGKYSWFSLEYKRKVCDFWDFYNKKTSVHLQNIFNKDKVYKKALEYSLSHIDGKVVSPVQIPDSQDLMSVPDLNEETFRLADIVNLKENL